MRHHKRRFGVSKYGIARYFHGAFDLATLILLTKFSQNPLYFFGLLSLPFMVLGGLIAGYLLVNHVLYAMFTTVGFQLTMRPLLILAIFLMLVGVLIFLIGLLSELVLRSASLGKGYWVRETISRRLPHDAAFPATAIKGGAGEPVKGRLEDQQIK